MRRLFIEDYGKSRKGMVLLGLGLWQSHLHERLQILCSFRQIHAMPRQIAAGIPMQNKPPSIQANIVLLYEFRCLRQAEDTKL